MNSILIKLLVSLVTIFLYSNGYDKICPHSSQWNFTSRSYGCADQKIYICLLDLLTSKNTNKTVFKETCGSEDISKEGTKYILNPNPEQVPCDAVQYQPFTFTTNGNSQCTFDKSLCKSRGQILAGNGSSVADTSCRCDYTRSFDYIIQPKDPCSCKPSEEDCSCYIRKCDDKVMIADYRCVKRVETILPEDIKCPIISSIIPPEETVSVLVDTKQFKQVSSSRTWSKQTSVILIVIVIIFTVLIGFLFFSVPHVKSILLISELELSVKRKVNEYLILNGDNVKIECNVKSYLPVRAVTWQKEIDGTYIPITPFKDKCEIVLGKGQSLIIDDFNVGDHQGKYKCIVRNVIGLKNEMFSSCMNHMSRVNWLTRIVEVLQHIPAFHTEDMMYMTLHGYDIDSQSNQTVCNVYIGDDITMKQHYDDEEKPIAVKWFKESGKWTELDMNNEQFNGGFPDIPSLTIKSIRLENAGNYLCLLIYDNGETQRALFKLKMIPQVKIYRDLLYHREDRSFIRTAICDTIDKQMQENKIVVIAGREGTGKSKICLELASRYDEKDYMVLKVDLSENHLIYTNISNALLIIDDQQYTQDYLNAFMKDLVLVLPERNIQVVLTCRNLDLKIVRNVPEINKLESEAFIDINSCLTPKEKEDILRRHMKKNYIAISASYDSNFRDPKILTDLSVKVTLDDDVINVVRATEPWKGFPLSASLFCTVRTFLHLGEKYFTNPPIYLIEELKELYKTAKKESNCMDKINDFCILVYIMNNNDHQLDLNDHNLYSQLSELYQTLFSINIPKTPGSNEAKTKSIEESLHRMNNKYLRFHEGGYEFIHPCMLKAVLMSSESMVPYLLLNGSLNDIIEFVRSNDYTAYTAMEDDLVIKIGEDYHQILCERLVRCAFDDHSLLLHVAQYIYSYWRSSGNNLVNKMFKHIEFILFKSLAVLTGDFLSLENESSSGNSINLKGPVQFSKIIMLVDELTYKGRDPWIYGPGTSHFVILSALVSAAMGRYATNRDQTFAILLEEFQKRMHSKSFAKLLKKPLDTHGNTCFHYLVLFDEMGALKILSVIKDPEIKYIFDTENVEKYTPIDISVYLGKRHILEVLNLSTNYKIKSRNRLKRLAKSGKAEYYHENNKNIDLPVVLKTKADNAAPENVKCEDAEDEQKEVNNESNKDIRIFKRKYSVRKEPYKVKKHNRNDVLCFEDFIINIVVFGDYKSIIELLIDWPTKE